MRYIVAWASNKIGIFIFAIILSVVYDMFLFLSQLSVDVFEWNSKNQYSITW